MAVNPILVSLEELTRSMLELAGSERWQDVEQQELQRRSLLPKLDRNEQLSDIDAESLARTLQLNERLVDRVNRHCIELAPLLAALDKKTR